MNIGVVIQARMGSTRLPGKVLKKIGSRTLLEHINFRLQYLKHKVTVVIATTIFEQDDQIEIYCKRNKLLCFRGSEENVLERYYQCAKQFRFDQVVRLTADNPFIDIEELDNLIALHINSKSDYTRSLKALPKGVGSEIFTFAALEKSFLYGNKENHKEHVNEYIEENEYIFNISELCVNKAKNKPEISLTVDTEEDYEKAVYIVNNADNEYITTEEAIELCMRFV